MSFLLFIVFFRFIVYETEESGSRHRKRTRKRETDKITRTYIIHELPRTAGSSTHIERSSTAPKSTEQTPDEPQTTPILEQNRSFVRDKNPPATSCIENEWPAVDGEIWTPDVFTCGGSPYR